MPHYPINLNLAGKRCAVIGGGAVAERKAVTILKAGGEVLLISPKVTDRLLALAAKGALTWDKRPYQRGDIENFFLVICATDNAEINSLVAAEAKQKGALVNIIDDMRQSDFTVPAQVRRGNLLITVSTNGQSPAVAREIKKEISARYGEEYEIYLDLVSQIRCEMKEALPTPKDRELFWQKDLDQEALALIREGKTEEAKKKLVGYPV